MAGIDFQLGVDEKPLAKEFLLVMDTMTGEERTVCKTDSICSQPSTGSLLRLL
jgi:hypothetical protein